MRWQTREQGSNIDERPSQATSPSAGRGLRGAKLALGAIAALVFIGLATSASVRQLLGLERNSLEPNGSARGNPEPPTSDEAARMIGAVIHDTETIWTELLAAQGQTYAKPKLVLFDDAVDSACGYTTAAVGPFYCGADRRVYLDLTFFSELSRRLGAAGDFAQAYVVAHEVGHHLQNLVGTSERVRGLQSQVNAEEAKQLAVRLELQADCYAGVWAHHASKRQLIEPSGVAEAMAEAAAAGADRLQKQTADAVRPETWTHGSSEQRVHWFTAGMQSGQIGACDTFMNGAP